ncbi:MAG: hypothetical protein EB051_02495 [Chlamydiia bacterium]|nr:hypothetical protein [Chlamydiia bacterium]
MYVHRFPFFVKNLKRFNQVSGNLTIKKKSCFKMHVLHLQVIDASEEMVHRIGYLMLRKKSLKKLY